MNKVLLVGRFTRDPELKTSGNTSFVRFSLAVDRRYKKDEDATADFPSCVAFGKTAEFISKYFDKGMKIGIAGRIQTGSYDDRNTGRTIYTTDVVVEEAEFVESKKASGNNNSSGRDRLSAAPPETSDDGFEGVPIDDDDLPFD